MGRIRYTKEFREEACRLVLNQGLSIRQAAKNLGISDGILGRWMREIKSPENIVKKALIASDDKRIRELEAEVKRLRLEKEILKKAMAYFVEAPK